jgi:hypothetical protein
MVTIFSSEVFVIKIVKKCVNNQKSKRFELRNQAFEMFENLLSSIHILSLKFQKRTRFQDNK